ncbi:MAG: hypothetical protein MUE31_06290, partial [Candidatus Nanopelagicales bacterium]|nr:hypothetical protein [Candidatus Nanopelagicales bacterium]
LGVEYVLLARTVEAQEYVWLDQQPDLQKVLETESMIVYRVLAQGTGRVVDRRLADYGQLLEAAASGALGTEAVTSGTGGDSLTSQRSGGLSKVSATAWNLEAGEPGWVVLPEEYSTGWQIAGRSGTPTLAGTIAFEVDGQAAMVEYAPWRLLLPATLGSFAVLLLLIAGGLVEHRKALSDRLTAKS